MALPGWQANVAEVSGVLALGSLALLAGHRWGILVVGAADVLMLGNLWPVVAFDAWDGVGMKIAACTALAAALPGLALLPTTIPRSFDLIFGRARSRLRGPAVAACSVAAVVWLAAPAYHLLGTPAPATAERATADTDAVAAATPERDEHTAHKSAADDEPITDAR